MALTVIMELYDKPTSPKIYAERINKIVHHCGSLEESKKVFHTFCLVSFLDRYCDSPTITQIFMDVNKHLSNWTMLDQLEQECLQLLTRMGTIENLTSDDTDIICLLCMLCRCNTTSLNDILFEVARSVWPYIYRPLWNSEQFVDFICDILEVVGKQLQQLHPNNFKAAWGVIRKTVVGIHTDVSVYSRLRLLTVLEHRQQDWSMPKETNEFYKQEYGAFIESKKKEVFSALGYIASKHKTSLSVKPGQSAADFLKRRRSSESQQEMGRQSLLSSNSNSSECLSEVSEDVFENEREDSPCVVETQDSVGLSDHNNNVVDISPNQLSNEQEDVSKKASVPQSSSSTISSQNNSSVTSFKMDSDNDKPHDIKRSIIDNESDRPSSTSRNNVFGLRSSSMENALIEGSKDSDKQCDSVEFGNGNGSDRPSSTDRSSIFGLPQNSVDDTTREGSKDSDEPCDTQEDTSTKFNNDNGSDRPSSTGRSSIFGLPPGSVNDTIREGSKDSDRPCDIQGDTSMKFSNDNGSDKPSGTGRSSIFGLPPRSTSPDDRTDLHGDNASPSETADSSGGDCRRPFLEKKKVIVKIPNKYVGRVIGSRGTMIISIQEQSGARVSVLRQKEPSSSFSKEPRKSPFRRCSIDEEQTDSASSIPKKEEKTTTASSWRDNEVETREVSASKGPRRFSFTAWMDELQADSAGSSIFKNGEEKATSSRPRSRSWRENGKTNEGEQQEPQGEVSASKKPRKFRCRMDEEQSDSVFNKEEKSETNESKRELFNCRPSFSGWMVDTEETDSAVNERSSVFKKEKTAADGLWREHDKTSEQKNGGDGHVESEREVLLASKEDDKTGSQEGRKGSLREGNKTEESKDEGESEVEIIGTDETIRKAKVQIESILKYARNTENRTTRITRSISETTPLRSGGFKKFSRSLSCPIMDWGENCSGTCESCKKSCYCRGFLLAQCESPVAWVRPDDLSLTRDEDWAQIIVVSKVTDWRRRSSVDLDEQKMDKEFNGTKSLDVGSAEIGLVFALHRLH